MSHTTRLRCTADSYAVLMLGISRVAPEASVEEITNIVKANFDLEADSVVRGDTVGDRLPATTVLVKCRVQDLGAWGIAMKDYLQSPAEGGREVGHMPKGMPFKVNGIQKEVKGADRMMLAVKVPQHIKVPESEAGGGGAGDATEMSMDVSQSQGGLAAKSSNAGEEVLRYHRWGGCGGRCCCHWCCHWC